MEIATLASHSALNILSGAQELGFKTRLYTNKARYELYKSFGVADKIIIVDDYKDIFKEKNLENVIFVPHGSFVAYLDLDKLLESDLKIFGTKKLLAWESDRELKGYLMKKAGFLVPKEFTKIDEVNRPIITKYYGAEGGKGYFIARDRAEILANIDLSKRAIFQEYIVGTTAYVTFFNSIIHDELELFSTDIRYESNVDSKLRFDDDFSFQIVGNIPFTLRESLLPVYYEMGKNFVKAVKENVGAPLVGPFCLETVIDKDLNIYVFEFSGRIVAGTNVWVPWSPYSFFKYREPMWMGKRIALEIKEAIEENRLDDIIQ